MNNTPARRPSPVDVRYRGSWRFRHCCEDIIGSYKATDSDVMTPSRECSRSGSSLLVTESTWMGNGLGIGASAQRTLERAGYCPRHICNWYVAWGSNDNTRKHACNNFRRDLGETWLVIVIMDWHAILGPGNQDFQHRRIGKRAENKRK
ncbi:hypothetical protein CKAH01_08017 [Colletotrichum kahawae]|uniref:Uncharacterized protein n=1 Tax=Colletotrichum kahawae TaxID=34407 RepID=A0AAD9Y3N8_COLKA|nr:hypothetical protein CKAH01_08017 [Colletotrichum kahawae]